MPGVRSWGELGTLNVEPGTSTAGCAVSGVAHWAQNFARDGFSVPHCVQRRENGAAHSMQNFARSGLSAPQLAQRMRLFYCIAASGTRSAVCRV